MPENSDLAEGAPCWIDLSSSDVDASIDFYGRLLGWEAALSTEREGSYVLFRKNDRQVAGIGPRVDANGGPDAWSTYLYSGDATSTSEAITAAGGQNIFDPLEVPRMGSMGYAIDPTGAIVGTWQPGDHIGFEAHGGVGQPVWHELHTNDYPAAVAFYERAFGWSTESMSDTEEFRYTNLVHDGDELAGIFDASGSLDGAPSNWQVYFGVRDTDREMARAIELGAKLVQPPQDSPYGRWAALTDTTGAYFNLITVEG